MYKKNNIEEETHLNASESTSLIDGMYFGQNQSADNRSFDVELQPESYGLDIPSHELNPYLGKPNIGSHIALLTWKN